MGGASDIEGFLRANWKCKHLRDVHESDAHLFSYEFTIVRRVVPRGCHESDASGTPVASSIAFGRRSPRAPSACRSNVATSITVDICVVFKCPSHSGIPALYANAKDRLFLSLFGSTFPPIYIDDPSQPWPTRLLALTTSYCASLVSIVVST